VLAQRIGRIASPPLEASDTTTFLQPGDTMKKTVLIGTALLLLQIPLLALVLLQERTWGGAQFDEGSGVATAPDNSVYVTGTTDSFGAGDLDAFLLKYDATGALQWERTFGTAPSDSSSLADEFGRAVAVSPDGLAIYISGQFGNGSLFLARFDPDGNLEWQRTWGDNGSIATGVAATSTDVYVTGSTDPIDRQRDAILLKFSADGTLQWNIAWGGEGFDNAHDVAVGTDGVYFAGDTSPNAAFVAKVDSNGTVLWARQWEALDRDGFPGLTSAFGMGTTADGGVVITGNASDISTLKNIILVKYSSTGTLVWQKIGGPGFGGGNDVAEAADGSLFVTGGIVASTKDPDVLGGFAFVAEFGADGRKKKASTWGGSPNDSAQGEGIAISANGTIAVAGFVHAPPYVFNSASNSSSNADATSTEVFSTAPAPAGTVNIDPGGEVKTPVGSQTYAGDTEAFFLRLQR
jgi:hypothetical protein